MFVMLRFLSLYATVLSSYLTRMWISVLSAPCDVVRLGIFVRLWLLLSLDCLEHFFICM